MRTIKCLLIVILLLVFVSGCSSKSVIVEPTTKSAKKPVATASTPQPSKTSNATYSVTPTASDFPPSDWPEKSIITYSRNDGKILYQEGINSDRFWTAEGLKYIGNAPTKDKPVVPDKETAVAIATIIFNAQKDKIAKNMAVSSVFYDTQDEVWIVTFTELVATGIAPGSVKIALRKIDAQVLATLTEAG